ncbi:hypothetical protein EYF80_025384 [Liparis tanakae]|uniref:Uncharacterized protein n=1 Tax=Liparis tanakae TaxID=230148 RepID=A0A4Z2HHQ1_9TELE|nr:hypothetical protein EYF80_025384 [Liparis tanakae]
MPSIYSRAVSEFPPLHVATPPSGNGPLIPVLSRASRRSVMFILFMATRSCLGVQRAACTTAVAPLPGIRGTTEYRPSGSEQRGTHGTHSWKHIIS